jgi:hypothetical protein
MKKTPRKLVIRREAVRVLHTLAEVELARVVAGDIGLIESKANCPVALDLK